MSLIFDYQCWKCGNSKTNQEMDSFTCECGGDFKHVDRFNLQPSIFEPHYNEVIKDWVHSWKDMEEKGKKFRSVDHPNGFVVTQGNTKFVKEMKYIHKNREEYIQEIYKKDGIKYKPGSKVNWSDEKKSFIPINPS